MLSKADRIRRLLDLTNREVAEIIGCGDAYVRSVRQRTDEEGRPRQSAAHRRYRETNSDYIRTVNRQNARKYYWKNRKRILALKSWRRKKISNAAGVNKRDA